MIDVNFFFEFSRRSTISDLTDQNYSDEFRRGVASHPSPPLVQNRLGAIGEERPVPPTSAPRSTPEPYGPSAGFNVVGGAAINIHNLRQREHHHQNHHQHQQQQQQHQQRPPNPNGRAGHAEQERRARHHQNQNADRPRLHHQGRAAHEPRVERPACCCFCYGTAKVEAAAAGRPVPPKDGPGYWSGHHSITDGRVVCPVLFEMVCGVCGSTGAEAHTTEYHLQHPELFRRHQQE